jgi:hypothetical protein
MAEKFSIQLRRRGDSIWRAIYGHRFLSELHAGTLSMERFTYFIFRTTFTYWTLQVFFMARNAEFENLGSLRATL